MRTRRLCCQYGPFDNRSTGTLWRGPGYSMRTWSARIRSSVMWSSTPSRQSSHWIAHLTPCTIAPTTVNARESMRSRHRCPTSIGSRCASVTSGTVGLDDRLHGSRRRDASARLRIESGDCALDPAHHPPCLRRADVKRAVVDELEHPAQHLGCSPTCGERRAHDAHGTRRPASVTESPCRGAVKRRCVTPDAQQPPGGRESPGRGLRNAHTLTGSSEEARR
jgi:hypothetical protein